MLREEYLDFFGDAEDEDGDKSGQARKGRRRGQRRPTPSPAPAPPVTPGKYDALLSRLEPIQKGPAVSGGDIAMRHAPNPDGTGSADAANLGYAGPQAREYRDANGNVIQVDARIQPGAEPHTAEYMREKLDAGIARSPDVEASRKKRSFWDRLGGGLWNAYKNWDGTGGWGNFLGNAITDGMGAAFDPKMDAELRRKRQLQEMFGEYQLRSGLEATDMAKAKSSLEVQKIMADIQNMGAEAAWKKWKPLFDQQMGANSFTPEAAAALTAAGFPVQQLDFRARELVERGGVPYSRAKTGPDDAVHVSGLPDDPTKYPIGYKAPITGVQGAATFDKILGTEGDVLANQARLDQQTQQFNASQQNMAARAHISDVNAWMNQSAAQRLAILEQAAKIPGLSGDLRVAVGETQAAVQRMQTIAQQMQMTPENDPEFTNLQAAFAEAERQYMTNSAKLEAARGTLEGAGNFVEQLGALPQKPMPNQAPVQTTTAPNVAGQYGKPSKADLEAALKRRGVKPGSSEWNRAMTAAGYR